jgi:hypothetical protein
MKRLKVFMAFFLNIILVVNLGAAEELSKLSNKESQEVITSQQENVVKQSSNTLHTPFTGEIVGEQVRVRLQPNLSGHIVKEMEKGDYVLVVGEESDFVAITPLDEIKAYVFRTFVLDGKIEGTHVNVRLEPRIEAPVVAQLNTGDIVNGIISSENSKWLEIDIPQNTAFYIHSDYVINKGPKALLVEHKQKKIEAKELLNKAYLTTQAELRKPFAEINEPQIIQLFQKVADEYGEFSKIASKAKEGLEEAQEAYLLKKVAFLENKTRIIQGNTQEAVAVFEGSSVTEGTISIESLGIEEVIAVQTDKMLIWEPVETLLYQEWKKEHPSTPNEEFYKQQYSGGEKISGYLEPYHKPVKNKPGDYVLRDQNNLPVAFVYSTRVNLQHQVGQHVTLVVSPRENNHFAFPAFFVLSVE